MIVKITAILVMAVFYAAYMGKKFSQKRQGVTTNQIAVGNKPRNVMMVEKIMGVATFLVIPVELLSIALYPKLTLVQSLRDCMPMQIAGVAVAALGVLTFISSTARKPRNLQFLGGIASSFYWLCE